LPNKTRLKNIGAVVATSRATRYFKVWPWWPLRHLFWKTATI